jgi:branched-chain amino acid transport system permease protein
MTAHASSVGQPSAHASVQRRRLVVFLVLFLILAAVPFAAQILGQPFYVRLFTRIMILGLAAISLDLLLGYGGLVSLGHAAFIGVGAYAVGILAYHAENGGMFLGLIPGAEMAWIVWPAAIVAGGLVAMVIGAISLRTSGFYFIMITLAFAQMLYYLFVSWQTYGGDDGLQIMQRNPPLDGIGNTQFYWVVFAVLLVGTLLVNRVIASRFGMVLRGARQNERRLRAIGVPVYRYRLIAFALAGALASLAGVLLANSETFVSPANMSWLRSAELIVMVMLGGIGTVYGGIVGAAVYSLLELILGNFTVHWQVIFGPFFVLVVLFARRGILSAVLGTQREA